MQSTQLGKRRWKDLSDIATPLSKIRGIVKHVSALEVKSLMNITMMNSCVIRLAK